MVAPDALDAARVVYTLLALYVVACLYVYWRS